MSRFGQERELGRGGYLGFMISFLRGRLVVTVGFFKRTVQIYSAVRKAISFLFYFILHTYAANFWVYTNIKKEKRRNGSKFSKGKQHELTKLALCLNRKVS